MAWDYRRGPGPAIQHEAGTVPPRPLMAGDEVVWESGHTLTIIGTTPTLLLLEHRYTPMFRKPIEGDYSDSVFERTHRGPIEGDYTQVST